jgi:hypothetical protein
VRLAAAISLLLAFPVTAGTLFDKDGNKIEVCKGSTCGVTNTPSPTPTPQVKSTNTNSNVNKNTNSNVNKNTNSNVNKNTNSNVNKNTNSNVNKNTNSNVNKNSAISNSNATGGNAHSSVRSSTRSSAQAISGGSTSNAVSGGSTSSNSVVITAPQAAKIPDNTPDVGLAVPPATSPCRIPVGAGGSSPGLGLTIGFSTLDEGCDTREDARTLWAVGLQGAAYARLCQKAEMAKAMGVLCQREEQEPAPVSSVTFAH